MHHHHHGCLLYTSIVETGDFKFDLTPVGSNADYQVMAYMGQIGVDLLMSDSTNSGVADFSISEKKVAAEILDTMKKTDEMCIRDRICMIPCTNQTVVIPFYICVSKQLLLMKASNLQMKLKKLQIN